MFITYVFYGFNSSISLTKSAVGAGVQRTGMLHVSTLGESMEIISLMTNF